MEKVLACKVGMYTSDPSGQFDSLQYELQRIYEVGRLGWEINK